MKSITSMASMLLKVTRKIIFNQFCCNLFKFQLSIYGDPEPVQLVVVEEKITKFRGYVSQARQWTWNYVDSIKVCPSCTKIMNKNRQASRLKTDKDNQDKDSVAVQRL